ncbi:MAG: hypothetical protein OCD76_02275 [Reichenbachiella sp.]
MTKISFELWGLSLLEPMALVFNWMMTLQAIYHYLKLKDDFDLEFLKYWKGFFLFFAISTFFGGLSHVFFGYFGMMGKIPGWISGLVAISYIEMSVTCWFDDQKKSNWQYFIFGRFILTCVLLSVNFQFTWVMIHTAIGVLGVLGFHSVQGYLQGKPYLRYYMVGILAMIFTVPIKLMGIDLHLWFNRDDISHVFMIIANISFFAGIKETMAHSLATYRK